MTSRDDLRVRKALQGAQFPAARGTLLAYAVERGADPKSMQALYTLPAESYENMEEVLEAIAQEPEGGDYPGGTAR